MIQEMVQNSGTQLLAIISMLFFISFFTVMAIVVVRTDPEKADEYSRIPLKDDLPLVDEARKLTARER